MEGYSVVSNFQRPGPYLSSEPTAFDPFSLATGALKSEECVTVAIGDSSRLSGYKVARLRETAVGLDPTTVAIRLVHIIRRAVVAGAGFSTIGSRITSIIIRPDISTPIQSHYHSAVVQRSSFMPALVTTLSGSQSVISNISITPVEPDTPAISVPVVPRNRPCPCQSGKKYKHCHGRKPSGARGRPF